MNDKQRKGNQEYDLIGALENTKETAIDGRKRRPQTRQRNLEFQSQTCGLIFARNI